MCGKSESLTNRSQCLRQWYGGREIGDLNKDGLRFYIMNGHEASREMVAVVLATKLDEQGRHRLSIEVNQ